MNFSEALLTLPTTWRFTHLMALEPAGYQCNIANDDYVCFGTGASPEEALAQALINIANPLCLGVRYKPDEHTYAEPRIDSSMDIAKLFLRREPITRRI